MHTKEIWKEFSSSVCQIIHKKSGTIISTGTGFKLDKYIISNNHVIESSFSDTIIIQFKDSRGIGILLEKVYLRDDFLNILKIGSPENSWDLAILEDDYFSEIKSIKFSESRKDFEIGQECTILGFPLSSNFLTIHSAIISSIYTNIKNNVKYIQLDASVNKGNSGGPLINNDNGELIGIITRKKTGFTQKFNELNKSFKHNLDHLKTNQGGTILIGNIDIYESLKVVQTQFSVLGKELERASNVGIGIAYDLDELRDLLETLK